MKIPEQDLHAGQSTSITFSIAVKTKKGGAWQDQARVDDLQQAFSNLLAIEGDVYERGLFVHFGRRGGFVYWTSLAPGTFNSSVLELQLE